MSDNTANDVGRWTVSQSKDIVSICQHVSHLSSTIESLKSELSVQQKKYKDVSSCIASTKKEAAAEREMLASVRRQYEALLKVNYMLCCYSSVAHNAFGINLFQRHRVLKFFVGTKLPFPSLPLLASFILSL